MSEPMQGALPALPELVRELMLIPGLSGHEGRVWRHLRDRLTTLGLQADSDAMGNLVATLAGGAEGSPTVMLFAHMDQLGFVIRKIEPDGYLRIERVGGVPERALPSQEVLLCIGEGRDRPAIITNKSHHATKPDEKYRVVPYAELFLDAGFQSAAEAVSAGVKIGTPVVYRPRSFELGNGRIAGSAVDDRAGCAVVLAAAEALTKVEPPGRPSKVFFVFSSQEEFNLRGALVAAQKLQPHIAIQIDLMLATDTPDMADRGEMRLGKGPGMSLYSFHGRGTLNGAIPHPRLVRHFEDIAAANGIALQRSAQSGVLTDASYVQLAGSNGVAVIDLGFPMRYSHSSLEVCDLHDLEGLTALLVAGIRAFDQGYTLDPRAIFDP